MISRTYLHVYIITDITLFYESPLNGNITPRLRSPRNKLKVTNSHALPSNRKKRVNNFWGGD